MTPLRQRLREATRTAHDRVDAAFGRYDLASRAGYRAFLERHARAVLPVEAAVERAGGAAILPDWSERRRAEALKHDLGVIGGAIPAASAALALDDEAQAWGALYVIEGSRLGARVLLRQVMASDDRAVRAATAYLAHGAGAPLWPRFIAMLEGAAPALSAPDQVAAGALRTFAVFEDAVAMEMTGD